MCILFNCLALYVFGRWLFRVFVAGFGCVLGSLIHPCKKGEEEVQDDEEEDEDEEEPDKCGRAAAPMAQAQWAYGVSYAIMTMMMYSCVSVPLRPLGIRFRQAVINVGMRLPIVVERIRFRQAIINVGMRLPIVVEKFFCFAICMSLSICIYIYICIPFSPSFSAYSYILYIYVCMYVCTYVYIYIYYTYK